MHLFYTIYSIANKVNIKLNMKQKCSKNQFELVVEMVILYCIINYYMFVITDYDKNHLYIFISFRFVSLAYMLFTLKPI